MKCNSCNSFLLKRYNRIWWSRTRFICCWRRRISRKTGYMQFVFVNR